MPLTRRRPCLSLPLCGSAAQNLSGARLDSTPQPATRTKIASVQRPRLGSAGTPKRGTALQNSLANWTCEIDQQILSTRPVSTGQTRKPKDQRRWEFRANLCRLSGLGSLGEMVAQSYTLEHSSSLSQFPRGPRQMDSLTTYVHLPTQVPPPLTPHSHLHLWPLE